MSDFGRKSPSITPTAADCAYAAGFFDGEGNITIAENKNVPGAKGTIYNMRVGASQNDIAPLIWLRARWGGSIRSMSRKTSAQNVTHQWWCFARMAASFLRDVEPFLQVKKDRAKIAIEFQSEKYNPGMRGLTSADRTRMTKHRNRLAALNGHKPLKLELTS